MLKLILTFVAALACLNFSAVAQVNRDRSQTPLGKVQTYKQTEQGALEIELFFPKDFKPGDRRPAIVFFFGGGWTGGNRNQFYPQAQYFARRGMVAATADYRIAGKHKTAPDKCVEDAKSAIRWMKAHAPQLGIDPEKVVASGGSAGGHIAAAAALCEGFEPQGARFSSRPAALVLFNPVLDMTGERMARRLPGTAEQRMALARRISPRHHLTKAAPPAIIFFGTEDALRAGTDLYRKDADALGVRAELFLAEGQAHGFFNQSPWLETTVAQADRFLASLGLLHGEPTIKAAGDAKLRKAE